MCVGWGGGGGYLVNQGDGKRLRPEFNSLAAEKLTIFLSSVIK